MSSEVNYELVLHKCLLHPTTILALKKIVTLGREIIFKCTSIIVYDFHYYLYFLINTYGNCLLFNLGFRNCCIRCLNDVAKAIDNLRKFYKVRTKTIFKKIIKNNYSSDFSTIIINSWLSSTPSFQSNLSPASNFNVLTISGGIVVLTDLERGFVDVMLDTQFIIKLIIPPFLLIVAFIYYYIRQHIIYNFSKYRINIKII